MSGFKFFSSAHQRRERDFDRAGPNKLLLADIGPETYVVSAQDKIIGKALYLSGAFDFEKFEAVLKLLPPAFKTELLLDIGANIGTICIPAIKRKHFRSAIAFEPEPRNFALLQANIALNGLGDRIVAINVALGSKPSKSTAMELSQDNSGDHRIHVSDVDGALGESGRQIIRIQTEKLDKFASKIKPHSTMIWMDTQGFEGEVATGASAILKSKPPLVMEFWPYGLKRSGCFDKLRNAVLSAKYGKMIDLKMPETVASPTHEAFNRLYEKLGDNRVEQFTDLLFL